MTGSALMDFVIGVVGLAFVVGLFFYAIDFISRDDQFKRIAKLAVGGVAVLVLLLAVKNVLFGGGGGIVVSPSALLEFAIGLLVILVVIYIVYLAVDLFLPAVGEPPSPYNGPVKYVIGAIALIALLVIAQRAFFGGGLGLFPRGHAMLALPIFG